MTAATTARSATAAKNSRPAAATPMDIGPLPGEQIQAGVRFLTGGIGLREAIAIKHAMHQYPLTLEFRLEANGKERFLTGVPVTIRILAGVIVLRTLSAGPFLLARLRPGRYEVMAEYRGKTQRREVEVRANGGERLVFEWNLA